MSRRHRLALPVLAFALGSSLAPSVAEAAILKSVQSGSVTMSVTPQIVTLTTAVTSSRAFVTCTSRTNTSAPDNLVTCELLTDTIVVITSGAANASLVVQWYVAEFDSGVEVERGTADFTTTQTQPGGTTVPINWVYLPRGIVLISTRTTSGVTSTSIDEQWTVRARMPTHACCPDPNGWSLSLELSRSESGIALTVAWQVVRFSQFPGVGPWNDTGYTSVQYGLTSMAASSTTASATLTTAVDVNTSFLIMTRRAGTATAGAEGKYQVMGEINATGTAVDFTRVTSGTGQSGVDIAWQVVTLTDGGDVRKGLVGQSTAFGSNTSTLTGTFTSAVDPTRTIPFISLLGGSGTTNTHLADTSWTAVVNGSDLTFERGVSTTIATRISYYAVQFFRCAGETVSSPLCHVAATASNTQATVNWSSGNSVIILRKDTTVAGGSCTQSAATCFLAGDNPVNGTSYLVGNTIGSATVVYNGTLATDTSFPDPGPLTNTTTYFYKVYPKTAATTYGAGTEVKATPRASPTLWSYMLAGGSALNPPIPGGNRVYASSNGNKIFSVNTSDGSQAATPMKTYNGVQGWVTWFPNIAGVEVVIGGDQGGYLYSMNPATGVTNWAWKSGYSTAWLSDNFQAAVSVQLRQWANAAFQSSYDLNYGYSGDVLFAASRDVSDTTNRVFAIKETDGDGLWNFDPVNLLPSNPLDIVIGQPYVDYGRNQLYVTSRAGAAGTQHSFWIINSLNGSLLAFFALGHIDASPTLSFNASTVYAGNNSGTLYAINAGALTLKWSSSVVSPASAVKGFIWEDYLTAGRLYFVTANGNVYCVQDNGASGTLCSDWTVNPRKPVASGTVSQPLLTESALYVGGSDGNLYQINPATGAIVTQFLVGDGTKTLGDVSSQDGTTHVYVSTSEGRTYKISLPLP